MTNTYTLYDNGKIVATKAICKKISKITGISSGKVSTQAKDGYRYNKRYLVVKDGECDIEQWKTDFMQGWKEVREAVEILKNHGKVMKLKGKWQTVAR